MAVHRIPVRCKSCASTILLRIVIAGGDQPFLTHCPHCSVTQRGYLWAEPESAYQFRSEDYEIVSKEDDDAPSVTVSTDMPVHSSFFGAALSAGFVSPFLFNISFLSSQEAGDLMERIEKLRSLRRHIYPVVRRIAQPYIIGDREEMLRVLAAAPGGKNVDWSSEDPYELFNRMISDFYEPFEDANRRRAALLELLGIIGEARAVDQEATHVLLTGLRTGPLGEHAARAVDVILDSFGSIDSILPALWVEALGGRVNLKEFRVMRDDFAVRKSQYQDLFELASQSILLISPIANLAKRNNTRKYADGKTRSPRKAQRETAFKRDAWLDDFPQAQLLYRDMSRHTRNTFGHALARYQEKDGLLIFDDGHTQDYLLFLIDQLSALRLSHYILDTIYILKLADIALSGDS